MDGNYSSAAMMTISPISAEKMKPGKLLLNASVFNHWTKSTAHTFWIFFVRFNSQVQDARRALQHESDLWDMRFHRYVWEYIQRTGGKTWIWTELCQSSHNNIFFSVIFFSGNSAFRVEFCYTTPNLTTNDKICVAPKLWVQVRFAHFQM